jgi:ribose transport system permease protein
MSTSEIATEPGASKERRPFLRRGTWQSIGPIVIFIAMVVMVSILTPAFLGGGGLAIIATASTPILFLALGQAMVLNVGSIDLSNAAIGLLGAILLALTLGPIAGGAPLLILLLTTLFGAVNGALVAWAQVPSFALTLGTLGIFQALALVISGRTTVYVSDNGAVVRSLYDNGIANVPLTFWLAVVVAVVLWAVMRYTRLGKGLTAIGKNESAAIFSAVRTRTLKIFAFAFSGFAAGLAGLAIIAQAGSASPTGLGSDLLLPAIAAALIGGTSISGGVVNPLAVIFGALTVALVPIASSAIGIDTEAQSTVYGAVIIGIVALTMTRNRSSIVK